MKYFVVRLYKFKDDVIYLNKQEKKTGTIKEPFKYYFEPILEYQDTLGKDIIISIDKKGIAREILTNIEIPIIYKDQTIAYNYDNFNYVKTFNNVIPPKGDTHTFSVIDRTIYSDFGKIVYDTKEPSYEEVKEYLKVNKNRILEMKKELENIFETNLNRVLEYKEILKQEQEKNSKIKKLINQFRQK